MEETKKIKACVCSNPVIPDNLPLPAHTYKGKAICTRCKGMITFPIGSIEEKVINIDEVAEKHINKLMKGSNIDLNTLQVYYLYKIANILSPKKDIKEVKKVLNSKSKK